MKRRHVLILLAPLAVILVWSFAKKNEPPEVPFAKVKRETLVSTLASNGKVEPLRYASVRVDTAGLVVELLVKEGQRVAQGAELAKLSVPGLAAQLATAQVRVEQARAELAVIERGGHRTELADIDANLARTRLDREAEQREYNALHRLEEKQAATREEVESARGKLRQTELEIEALDRKRTVLVGSTDRAVAEARLREAEAEVRLAERRIADSVVRAPMGGVVYGLPVRLGAYLNAGDPVANIGVLDHLRVRIYIDEPELGRVAAGLPVNITWDASPGKQWQGTVEQLPTQIQPLGTRQVGEVLCTIENPGRELIPGTNVNAEIRASVIENALTIPKEAMRRDTNGTGVFAFTGGAVHWRPVKAGSTSISRVQILEGVTQGDAVALPTSSTLHDGQKVTPVYP
ncbi:MAG: efflux RND transporter periplasmic adaptor subunit [Acidobacteriia bacterium]|nr:efflux RND transporter periplasmic adaptor subunit [Terriglobia bacterium]